MKAACPPQLQESAWGGGLRHHSRRSRCWRRAIGRSILWPCERTRDIMRSVVACGTWHCSSGSFVDGSRQRRELRARMVLHLRKTSESVPSLSEEENWVVLLESWPKDGLWSRTFLVAPHSRAAAKKDSRPHPHVAGALQWARVSGAQESLHPSRFHHAWRGAQDDQHLKMRRASAASKTHQGDQNVKAIFERFTK